MKNLKIVFCLLIACCAFQYSFAQNPLVPHKISLKNGASFNLNLPAEYEIIPAAEGLKRVRFFAAAPDGRIFVTDMHDLTDNKKGAVYILEDFNRETGKFARVVPYLTNLKNPNSAAFYTDANGQDWFYLAETDKLTRRPYRRLESAEAPVPRRAAPNEDQSAAPAIFRTIKWELPLFSLEGWFGARRKNPPPIVADERPQILATFPDYGLSYKYGGWHLTRTIAFAPGGKLYVSVGSSCNACEEKEKVRATVLEMNADGSNQRVFAKGLRNAVGLKWIENNLFATNQGSDHLGLNKPDETFYALKNGADYGWASCYQSSGRIFADAEHKRLKSCANVPKSYAFFPAHSSAMGFDYFNGTTSDDLIKNSFLVALHGSTNKDLAKGYRVVIVRKDKRLQDFISGFLQNKKVVGRPCDIMRLDENSFLFTDDHSGVVYLVRQKR